MHILFAYAFLTRRLPFFLRLFLLTISVATCVSVQPPEGGTPDEVPPKLLHTFPANGRLNFKGKKIRVTFDKDISVDNIYNKLLIMPQLAQPSHGQPFTYKVHGATIELTFHTPLKDDTTYSIHFNDAIKDLHEGTKAVEAILTFSTGSNIDPITAKGRIIDLLTNQPVEEARVYLYYISPDQKEWKEWQENSMPDYYTTTDKIGRFTIDRIRLGHYYIRATTGKHSKYSIHYDEDKYGFLKDPIDLQLSRENIVVPLVEADVRDFKLLRTAAQEGLFEIILNKPVKHYQLMAQKGLQGKERPRVYSSLDGKTSNVIVVYNTFGLLSGEQLPLKLQAEDGIAASLEKELPISFKDGRPSIVQGDLTYSLVPRAFPSVGPNFTERFLFNKPIETISHALIYFECKNGLKIPLQEGDATLNSNCTKLTIKKPFTADEVLTFSKDKSEDQEKNGTKQSIILKIEAGALVAFDKSKNQPIQLTYPLRTALETGSISGKIETQATHFRIELLDGKGNIVDAIRNSKQYQFALVPPGNYRLRILVWKECSKDWSPGNIRKNIEPDPVLFYDKELIIVAQQPLTDIDLTF